MSAILPERDRAKVVAASLARWPAWADAIVAALLCVALAACVYGIGPSDIDVPLISAGDGASAQFIMKTVLDHGWYTQNPDVGAPFGATMYDYPIPEPAHLLLIRALSVFGDDPFLVFNLFYLLSFVTTALAAWWSLRFLGADRWTAFAGTILFTLLPYHFGRIAHVYLASYFAAPVFAAHAARLALYRAPHVRDEVRQSLASVVLIALAGGGGIYYAFFGCLLLAAGAALGAIRSGRLEPLRIGGTWIAIVVVVVAATLAPNWLYHMQEGANPLVAQRRAFEVEYYGLRITQLLLPSSFHRFEAFRALTGAYNASTPLINENTSATLGLFGDIGFLASLAIALTAWRARFPRVAALGVLSLVCILFATIGGFGSLFAFLVTPEMRGLNRISVCIAFFAIAAFFFLARRALRAHPLAFAALALVSIPLGLFDEIPLVGARQIDAFRARQAFFDRFEAVLPAGTAVFQLPYMSFPESANKAALGGYDLFEPYLRTHGYRWSFGDMHGRASDLWNEQASTLQGSELAAALASAGFGAIYVDRRGYADHGAAVERDLAVVFGPPVLEDGANNIALYRITSRAPGIPFVVVASGRNWLPWTRDSKGALTGSAAQPASDLLVANPGHASRVEAAFTIISDEARHIALSYGGVSLGGYDLAPGKPQRIVARFTAEPGVSRLVLDGDGARETAKKPAYRIENLEYGPAS